MQKHNCLKAISWSGNLPAVLEFVKGLSLEVKEDGPWLRIGCLDAYSATIRRDDWIVRDATTCGVMAGSGHCIDWIFRQPAAAAQRSPSEEQRLTWLLPSMTEFIEDAEGRAQEFVSDDVFPHDGTSLARLRGLLRDACRRWLEDWERYE